MEKTIILDTGTLDWTFDREDSANTMHAPIQPDQLGQQIVQLILTKSEEALSSHGAPHFPRHTFPERVPGNSGRIGWDIRETAGAGVSLTNSEPAALLEKIAQTLGQAIQVDTCLIVAANQCQIGFWSNNHSWIPPQTSWRLELVQPELATFSYQAAIPVALRQILPVQSLMLMATYWQGTANGVIFVGDSQPRQWTNLDQQLLRSAASSVALALSQIELQQQARRGTTAIALVRQLRQASRYSDDLNEFLSSMLKAAAQTLQVEGGVLLRFKYQDPRPRSRGGEVPSGKAEILCQWSAEAGVAKPSKYRMELAEFPLFQRAWQQAPHPLAIAERAELLAVTSPDRIPAPLDPDALSAILMVPLVKSHSDGSTSSIIVGFLVLYASQPRIWHADEIELVEWVAMQITTAILQSQTLRRVQSLVDERTAQLRLSLEVQAKLSEKMRQQIEQLRRLNQVKDEFIANTSDALKHPLTKMKMATEMLKLSRNEEQRERYLEILESECAKEIDLVNDLLTLHHSSSQPFPFRPQKLDFKLMVDELARAFEQTWADKGLTLAIAYSQVSGSKKLSQSSLMLYSDPESLRRILLELLTNAGKFSAPNTTVYLDAIQEVSLQHHQVSIRLTNTGLGIAPEEQELIFDKFHRGKNATQGTAQGTGLGLALVKSLVQHLNGTIEVSSQLVEEPYSVTTFTLFLPQLHQQEHIS